MVPDLKELKDRDIKRVICKMQVLYMSMTDL